VEEAVSWAWQDFLELARVEVTSDTHCVTRWSQFDNRGSDEAAASGRSRSISVRYFLLRPKRE